MLTHAPALAVEGLTKRYGDRAAVDHLTVALPRGVVAGFIGPNGAGKTTTMAMLLGLVRPTSGTGTVLGEPLERPERYLGRVGALVEGPALWPALTAVQNLHGPGPAGRARSRPASRPCSTWSAWPTGRTTASASTRWA